MTNAFEGNRGAAEVLLAILAMGWLFNAVIEILNMRSNRAELPQGWSDVYEPEAYRKAQDYQRVNVSFGFFSSAFHILTIWTAAKIGFFQWFWEWTGLWIERNGWSWMGQGVGFVLGLICIRSILQIPFSVYSTFVIEARFGFNKTSPRTFVADFFKGLVITGVLGGPLIAAILWFFERGGGYAWLWGWLVFSGFQIVLMFFAPAVLMPLFNRFEPLPEGELKKAVEEYNRGLGFHVQGIYTMDGSRRSSKANAFFTGFGRFKKLVLFDTLVSRLSVDELVAVFAHEVGHFRLGHIPRMIFISIAGTGAAFFLIGQVLKWPFFYEAFGMREHPVAAGFVFIMVLAGPILRFFSLIPNAWSRKHEYEADDFSFKTYPVPGALRGALRKLAAMNLSTLTPHPWKVLWDYSHPPVMDREKRLASGERI